mgnify:CR=1 FL=1
MKANSRTFMQHVKTQYWKGSPNKQWADKALKSYERISKRGKR